MTQKRHMIATSADSNCAWVQRTAAEPGTVAGQTGTAAADTKASANKKRHVLGSKFWIHTFFKAATFSVKSAGLTVEQLVDLWKDIVW
jgi:hypothetical protein